MVKHRMLNRRTLHSQRGWAWLASAAPWIGAALGAAGSVFTGENQRKSMHEQMDAQREFAQMGVRWRVADAKAAGVHPLYALGAQTASYTPVSVGDTGIGTALQGLGQDVSSAYARQQSQQERMESMRKMEFRQAELDQQNRLEAGARLRGLELENQLREMDVRDRALGLDRRAFQAINAPTQVGPGWPSAQSYPVAPQSDVNMVKIKPNEITSRSGIDSSSTAGSHPGSDRIEIAPGEFFRLPTTEQGERLEGLGEVWKTILAPYFWYRAEYGQNLDRRYEGEIAELRRKYYRKWQNRGLYPRRKGM